MLLAKTSKSLLYFIGILMGITILIIGGVLLYFNNKYTYNAELSDMEWKDGTILIRVRKVFTDNSEEHYEKLGKDAHANHVISSDGKIETKFVKTKYGGQEFLSPSKMLFSGKLDSSKPEIINKSRLYYITTSELTPIEIHENNPTGYFSGLSLSPNMNYLRFINDKNIYISAFDFNTLGEAQNLSDLIPEEHTKKPYFFDGSWMKDNNIYVLKIRDGENHIEMPSSIKGNPPVRIQNEIARYYYYPEKNEIEEIYSPLSDTKHDYSLKTMDIFLDENDKKLLNLFDYELTNGDYKFIHNYKDGSLGIKEKQTGKKAKLFEVHYYADGIPSFDVMTYQIEYMDASQQL